MKSLVDNERLTRQCAAESARVPVGRCVSGRISSIPRKVVLTLTTCCILASAAAAEDPEVIVEIDKRQIYEGESFIYNVTLNHMQNPEAPTLDGFDDFIFELQGQKSLDSRQITIINGRRTEVVRRGMLYQYRLTPVKAGQLIIPAPSTVVEGKTITGQAIPVTVIPPQDQDIVLLELAADKRSVYPMQPFTITLTIAVQQLPDRLSERSPLSVQAGSPVQLTVSWLNDQQIPDGLRPQQSWREILEPIVSSSSRRQSDGMQINDIGSQSAFSFFDRSSKTVFLPPSKRTTRTQSDGTAAGYVEYTLQRTFVPEKVGEFRFGAANIKGTFATTLLDDDLQGEDLFAVSKSLTVMVKDVPSDGRPESYIGAIGTFDISADLVPKTASVGEPLTLTVTVFGEGTIADIRPPDIEKIPGIEERFRTYDATEKTAGNGRIFTYSLRALSDDVAELPAIPVAYFDVKKEAYVVLETAPIPLTISAAKQLSTSDIVANRATSGGGDTLEVNDAGLFANHSSLQNLRAVNFSIGRWMTLWIAMIAGYLGLSFGLHRAQRLHADPALLKRRRARSRATESLNAIRNVAGSDENISSDALSKIVAGLIADFTGTSEAGMTSYEATAALSKADIDAELQNRVTRFMDECDAARFGAGSSDSKALLEQCQSLVADLSRELGKRC